MLLFIFVLLECGGDALSAGLEFRFSTSSYPHTYPKDAWSSNMYSVRSESRPVGNPFCHVMHIHQGESRDSRLTFNMPRMSSVAGRHPLRTGVSKK